MLTFSALAWHTKVLSLGQACKRLQFVLEKTNMLFNPFLTLKVVILVLKG